MEQRVHLADALVATLIALKKLRKLQTKRKEARNQLSNPVGDAQKHSSENRRSKLEKLISAFEMNK